MSILTMMVLSANATVFTGFYTGSPAYDPGELVDLHGSWTDGAADVVFRLIDVRGNEIVRSETVTLTAQETRLGSFVEFAELDLSGQTTLTIEGFVYPTMVGTDTVVLAGQASADDATVALGIDVDGHLFALAKTTGGMVRATSSSVLSIDDWVHVALTYDGGTLKVLENGAVMGEVALTGALASTGLPFRIGARAEAPGWLTGVADARFEDFVVWKSALTSGSLADRALAGEAGTLAKPPAAETHLLLDFNEGAGGVVSDHSSNGYVGQLVNHGTPAMAAVVPGEKALRLNHDQLVDAGWPVSASLSLPADLASGLYVVEVLPAPNFQPQDHPDYEELLIVRPGVTKAPMAVVMPTNTWMGYNGWPTFNYWGGGDVTPELPSRPRTPGQPLTHRQGNNSFYFEMGDGQSLNHYMSWRRPNALAVSHWNVRQQYEKGVQSHLMMKWLASAGYEADVYTQRDAATGRLNPDDYSAILLHGHSEFWSGEEMDFFKSYLDGGGSVISLGANMASWRVSYENDTVWEASRHLQFGQQVGPQDIVSAVDGQMLSAWLAIESCEGDRGTTFRGTLNDIVIQPGPANQGLWRVDQPGHWLLSGLNVAAGDRFGVDINGMPGVGHETDASFVGFEPMGVASGEALTVLATGTDFGAPFTRVDYDIIRAATCEDLSQPGIFEGVTLRDEVDVSNQESGEITYYPHAGGGHVLSVGAVVTPSTLGADPVMTALVSHAIDCFALGQNCEAEQAPVDTNVPPTDTGGQDSGTPPSDTSVPPSDTSDGRSCGCQSTPTPTGFLLLFLPIVAIFRRR